jgi:hypothetical protein
LPGFHNLAERYEQFEAAIKKGPIFVYSRNPCYFRITEAWVAFYQKLDEGPYKGYAS